MYKGDRSRYLAALRRADDGDAGPLGEFLARAVLDDLYKFVVPTVAGRARLAPLPALATEEVSANVLRVARSEADSRPPGQPTAHGEAREHGWTSTKPPGTSALEQRARGCAAES
jgi:hypothetical protein